MEKGGAAIEDFGSTNGTFVNGERVQQRRELASGDRIKIGTWEFEVQIGRQRGRQEGGQGPQLSGGRARAGVSATTGADGRDTGRGLDADDDEENVIWSVEKSAARRRHRDGQGLDGDGQSLDRGVRRRSCRLFRRRWRAKPREKSPPGLRKGHDDPAQRLKDRTAN